jgi:hypothetical protein
MATYAAVQKVKKDFLNPTFSTCGAKTPFEFWGN